MIKNLPISTGDVGLIPRLGRSLGAGNGSSWEETSQARTHPKDKGHIPRTRETGGLQPLESQRVGQD